MEQQMKDDIFSAENTPWDPLSLDSLSLDPLSLDPLSWGPFSGDPYPEAGVLLTAIPTYTSVDPWVPSSTQEDFSLGHPDDLLIQCPSPFLPPLRRNYPESSSFYLPLPEVPQGLYPPDPEAPQGLYPYPPDPEAPHVRYVLPTPVAPFELAEPYQQAPFLNSLKLDAQPRIKTRKGLPVSFEIDTGTKTITTGYDTGTQGNHMSLNLAKEMGYAIDTREQSKGQFELANGKMINSLGTVTAKIRFANTKPEEGNQSFVCYFNVFRTLAVPALIGMAFLSATETLTRFTSRLVDLPQNWKRSLRVCAVGSAANRVSCFINGKPVIAYADTGSEVALVNDAYAMKHGLHSKYGREELMLADGSLEYTSGYTEVEFKLPRRPDQSYEAWRALKAKKIRFHILKNLQFDVLLDEDMIDQFQIFQKGAHALVSRLSEITPCLAPIIHLSKAERKAVESFSAFKNKLKRWTSATTRSGNQEPSPTQSSNNSPPSAKDIRDKINELDQEENRRRDGVQQNFARDSEEAREESRRRQRYQLERDKLIRESQ